MNSTLGSVVPLAMFLSQTALRVNLAATGILFETQIIQDIDEKAGMRILNQYLLTNIGSWAITQQQFTS